MEEKKTDLNKILKETESEKKEEIPSSPDSDVIKLPGKKERILIMLISILKAVLRFFERRMLRLKQRRLIRRMGDKK